MSHELQLADVADGALPRFLSEQRPAPSPEQAAAEACAAREAQGEAAWDKARRNDGPLTRDEFADMCHRLDPTIAAEPSRGRYR